MLLAFFTIGCQPITTDYDENATMLGSKTIIGAGASGLSAGIRLLELGIEPLILEKEATVGGAGIHAGRFFAVDTIFQANQNITDEEFLRY